MGHVLMMWGCTTQQHLVQGLDREIEEIVQNKMVGGRAGID